MFILVSMQLRNYAQTVKSFKRWKGYGIYRRS